MKEIKKGDTAEVLFSIHAHWLHVGLGDMTQIMKQNANQDDSGGGAIMMAETHAHRKGERS